MSRARIRQSQVVSTYGLGALADLSNEGVLVTRLEHWSGDKPLIHEPRLLESLRERLKLPLLELRAPPVAERRTSRRDLPTANRAPTAALANSTF